MSDKRVLLPAAPELREGDHVRTPTGREAEVLRVDERTGEAVVRWADLETAAFRLRWLVRQEP